MHLRSKGFYEKSERQKIVEYIIEKNLYFKLRGNAAWIEMENMQICPGRSWQSMKQHFHTNIIKSLDTLHIAREEKNRIYDCYYKIYLPMKRKRISNSDSTEDKIQHNTPKKNKLETSDDEKLPEVVNLGIRNTKHEHDIFDKKNMEDIQKSKSDGTVEENLNGLAIMNAENENANGQDVESSILIPYSEQEDKNIIIYIKENMNWNDLEYFDDIYENCHERVLLKRSATSIKHRFLNVILPNLYQYGILDVEEIVLFYDRAGIDLTPELEVILSKLLENSYSSSENASDHSRETRDNILNLSFEQIGFCTMNNNKSKNSNTAAILNTTQENRNVNSQKNPDNITKETERETKLENKLDFSANNHTDQDICVNPLQKQNISFNNDNQQKSHNKDTNENNENATVKYNYDSKRNDKETLVNFHTTNHTDNPQENIEELSTEDIEKVNVAVQANVANNMCLTRYLAGQLCLNINNEEHAFIPDSKNNDPGILTELQLKHNIKNDNIHIISEKMYNDLKRINELNKKIDMKILNVVNKNLVNPAFQLKFDKIKSLGFMCQCISKKIDEKLIAPITPVNKRQRRILHLPLNCKHLKNNTHLENICKCCTRVQENREKKSKIRKKFRKSNVANESNNNAKSSTNNKDNYMESNCNKDKLYDNVVFQDYINNSTNVGAEMDVDVLSEHSSPIISMSKRHIKVVDIKSLMSKEIELCNVSSSGNIENNSHISNIQSKELSIKYNSSNNANNDTLSTNFASDEMCDMEVLRNCSNFEHDLRDPLNISDIPYLSDCKDSITLQPSILENGFREELISGCTLNDENKNLSEKENNSETEAEIIVGPIICDEFNERIFSNNSFHNYCETNDKNSNLFQIFEEKPNVSSSIEMQDKNIDSCITGLNVIENNSNGKISVANFDTPVISCESSENFISCVDISQQPQNIVKEEIQHIDPENSTEEVKSLQVSENINCSIKDKLLNCLWVSKENLLEIKEEDEVDNNMSCTCDKNVLQKTKITYKNKIFFKRSNNLLDKKNTESSHVMHEIPCSTTVGLESLNNQCVGNIDLNDDTSVNDITMPLIFDENYTLKMSSEEFSEIRLRSNCEINEICNSNHSGTSKPRGVFENEEINVKDILKLW